MSGARSLKIPVIRIIGSLARRKRSQGHEGLAALPLDAVHSLRTLYSVDPALEGLLP